MSLWEVSRTKKNKKFHRFLLEKTRLLHPKPSLISKTCNPWNPGLMFIFNQFNFKWWNCERNINKKNAKQKKNKKNKDKTW